MDIVIEKDGELVFRGDWRQAPEPVRAYIQAAEGHHGPENLKAYMLRKGTPTALGMRGYSVRVV